MTSWIEFKDQIFESCQVVRVAETAPDWYELETASGKLWAHDGPPRKFEIAPTTDPQLRVLAAHFAGARVFLHINALIGWEVQYTFEDKYWQHICSLPIVGEERDEDAEYGVWDTTTDTVTVANSRTYTTRDAFETVMRERAVEKAERTAGRTAEVIPIKH